MRKGNDVRKRPLCLAALLLVMILWILPKDVWLKEPDIPSGKTITITGTVIKREAKEESQAYYLKNCQWDRNDSKFSVLAFTQKGTSYPIGCELSLYGTIYQLSPSDNPGQFDAESYYQSQGILYTFQVKSVISARGEAFLKEKVTNIRDYLSKQLSFIFQERDCGILRAVLLGDKSTLREEDQLLYQKNGISHLLAISGLHISMIGIGLYQMLRKCSLTFLEAGFPSGIFILVYGMMTGFGISTVRAVCMFVVMIFADIMGRTYDMASAMSLAALIILFRNPLQASQAGFLLSFGAVLGICFVYPILQSVFETKGKFAKTVLISVSLTLMTYPLTVHFFYEYPLYSILLNFIVIPCMPVVMISGGTALLTGCVWKSVGKMIGIPAHLVLSFYEVLGERVVKLPHAVVRLGSEEPWQLAAYYILLTAALLGIWYGRRRVFSLILPLAILIITLRFRSPLEFTAMDVGQGDALYLKTPGETTFLIDAGSTSVKSIGKYRILPYLKHEGVEMLDYVIFTHLDEDHINGIRELLEMQDSLDCVKIKQMLFPAISNPDEAYQEMWNLALEKGIAVGTIGAGDHILEEQFGMECIYPVKGSYAKDKNDSSTVLKISFGEFSMLLSGDAGFESEEELLKMGSLKDVDVWKVSHHGSKYSGSEMFLEKINPRLSLISVGKNTYGHPSAEVLSRLERTGSLVETTLDHGALILESDGKTFSLSFGR